MAEPSTVRRRRLVPGGRTRWRITLIATAAAAVVFGLAAVAGLQLIRNQQQDNALGRAIGQVGVMRSQVEAGVLPGEYDGEFPFEIVDSTGNVLVSQVSLQPFDQDGPVVLPPSDPDGAASTASDGLLIDTGQVALHTPEYVTSGLDGLTLTVVWTDLAATRIPSSTLAPEVGAPSGTVRIAVLVTPFDVEATVAQIRSALVVALPVTLLVLAVVVWWSVGRALRPVAAIRDRMTTITGDNLDARVPEPRTGDEVQDLASAVNDTLDRLAAADRQQRSFVSDAAHELRSPIAALHSTLEIADRYPDQVDPAHTDAAIRRQVARLSALSENLLTLAGLDRPLDKDEPIDVVAVVDAVVGAAAGGVVTVPIRWSAPADRPLTAGDPVEIERALTNVLNNAGRHARSQISIDVQKAADTVTVAISNDGPAIPDTELERIFERLVRLDEARSLDAGGSGLGLAIVRSIVHRHGGQVRAENRSAGPAFVITLPTVRTPLTPG